MAKKFTQEELNKIVTSRLCRERERLKKEFEATLKRCMASVHLNLYEEMCSLKRGIDAETKDALSSDIFNDMKQQQTNLSKIKKSYMQEGGEKR